MSGAAHERAGYFHSIGTQSKRSKVAPLEWTNYNKARMAQPWWSCQVYDLRLCWPARPVEALNGHSADSSCEKLARVLAPLARVQSLARSRWLHREAINFSAPGPHLARSEMVRRSGPRASGRPLAPVGRRPASP